MGISILSRHATASDGDQEPLVILDVVGFPLERHWYFVYPVGKNLPATAQAFMEFTRCHAKQFASEKLPEVANHESGQFLAAAGNPTQGLGSAGRTAGSISAKPGPCERR
ncbi:MAG TPA: LysR substrate-binding domain-containing protein, partial [Burkholderiales bacterium]|nr:LysR substrate-binding domain-containing protein [Burkholderiales bacterium]